MTRTNCVLFKHKSFQSYLNHLVQRGQREQGYKYTFILLLNTSVTDFPGFRHVIEDDPHL
jgi:hypothetical protein